MNTDFRIVVPRMDYGLCFLTKHIPYSILLFVVTAFFGLSLNAQPGMSCIAEVNVTLGSNGKALVTPQMFLRTADPTHVVVSIPGSDDSFVDCSFLYNPVEIMLRDTMTGALCWSDLIVEDKSNFVISFCRADTSISCLSDPADLDVLDFIDIDDNCLSLEEILATSPNPPYIDEINVDSFTTNPDTVKLITRTWILRDKNGHTEYCETTIAVNRIDLNLLQAPDDINIYCPDDPYDLAITGDIPYDWNDLLELCKISVDTSTYTTPLLCDRDLKYNRKWIFMDWVRDTMIMDVQQIVWKDTTPIKLLVQEPLQIIHDTSDCGFLLFIEEPLQMASCSDSDGLMAQAFVDGMNVNIGDYVFLDYGEHELKYTGVDECGINAIPATISFEVSDSLGHMLICPLGSIAVPINSGDEVWVWAQSLFAGMINDNCGASLVIKARKQFPTCSDMDTVFSDLITFCMAEVFDPINIEVVAVDTVTMVYSDTCVVQVTVQDKVAPELICEPDTVKIYLSTIDTTVTFDTFTIINHLFDLSGIGSVTMTGSGTGLTGSGYPLTGSGLPFFVNGVFMEFDCDDLDTYDVHVSSTDIFGNENTCMAVLSVLDTSNLCPPPDNNVLREELSGFVRVDGYMPLKNVRVQLESELESRETYTNADGTYTFKDLLPNTKYDLHLDYSDEWIRGLSAFDLYLLQKYVIGISEDMSVYQMLSADVNASSQIDGLDLIDLKRIILDLSSPMTAEKEPWLFVEDIQKWSEEELMLKASIPHFSFETKGTPGELNFYATKRGDIDGDIMDQLETRSNSSMVITSNTEVFKKNQEYTVLLSMEEWADIKALEFSMESDYFKSMMLERKGMDYVSNADETKVIYFSREDVDNFSDEPLAFTFIPKVDLHISDLINFTTSIRPTAYYVDGTKSRISRTIERIVENTTHFVKLDLNTRIIPNPVGDVSLLYVDIDSHQKIAENITLSIYDMLGREIKNKSWNNMSVHEIFPLRLGEGLKPGFYSCQLVVDRQMVTNTFVKR